MLIPSYYASTFHEDPTRGNNLPYDQAVVYNEWKRAKNRMLEHNHGNIKTTSELQTHSKGLHNQRIRTNVVYPQRRKAW